jgi:DNA-binding NarL/FixJ family response regulator
MEPITILLVDDNPIFLRLAAGYLEHFNELMVVATANNGEDGLAKAADLRPQIVLLDLAMPGLSGLEVIPRLRAILPEVSIIILTGHSLAGYEQAALAAGAAEFVPKADMSDKLLPAIGRVARANNYNSHLSPPASPRA